ncbi:MAG: glycoside hydrolase family 127 protein [Thermoguttaceae bacterium]|nr:glycoside hydrolase family 127 protein [Thermoguttaceae bacterium]
MKTSLRLALFLLFLLPTVALAQKVDVLPQKLASFPDLRADYQGEIGTRMDAVVQNWVLRAPKANPAMLSVLQLRERQPKSSGYYVPWVGEFVGKYLENAILFLQTRDDPELQATVRATIRALIASQDKDGYLGAYSKDERLVVCWDLWAHYHAMSALTLYYERYRDPDALEAARRAGFFFEKIFFNPDKDGNEKRVSDVGSDEVNFSIMTALCQLYRITCEEHFLDAARKVLVDLQERGDFYRQGLAGTEFYKTPQPRWESLHTILGLEELARAEGDESYRRAFLNLWESVYKRDVHNNGSFSSNEGAIGTPFKNAPIETCCTVAWIATTVEALRATGDPRCADALENALYNAVCAYTHPSGSWCSYNTPMNGRREASFHTIVFQSRPGQPELNCCSVNSPRGFAELVNWGVMRGKDDDGDGALYLNYYGEGSQTFLFNKKKFVLTQKTNYPVDGKVEIELGPDDGSEETATLCLRVPEWADGATLATPEGETAATPGKYVAVKRTWKRGETIALNLPMKLRYVSGDGDFAGKISVYYGPLLLAYDQYFNAFEEDAIPTISPKAFDDAKIELVSSNPDAERVGFYSPQIFVRLTPEDASAPPLFLVDFAFAGSLGATYASWLPATQIAPPVPACDSPGQNADVAPGAIPFSWRSVVDAEKFAFTVQVSDSETFDAILFEAKSTDGKTAVATPEQTKALEPGGTYFWKVVAENEFGRTESLAPGRRFSVDASLPEFDYEAFLKREEAKKTFRPLIVDALDGKPDPEPGTLKDAVDATSGENSVRFNGQNSIVIYRLEDFPRVQYKAELEFKVTGTPERENIAQIVSAWGKGMDDPLRVAIDAEGRIYGAVESTKAGGMTQRVPIEKDVWHKLRVVKRENTWTVRVDDRELGTLNVEEVMSTDSTLVALGGNPLYRNEPEFFDGEIRNFQLSGLCQAP